MIVCDGLIIQKIMAREIIVLVFICVRWARRGN